MTKVEIVKEIIEKKELELNAAQEAVHAHNVTVKQPGYKAIVDKYFNDFTSEDIYTKVSTDGETITFLRPHVDYNYDKDVMDLRLRTDWKTGEITEVSTSVYSTSDNSLWELERLQLVGQVASVLIDYTDDLIAEISSFKEEIAEESKALRKVVYAIQKDIHDCNDQINAMYLLQAETNLHGDGLVFDKTKKASLDLRFDHTLRNINSAKILSKTTSGKSCDIEIQAYDYQPQVYKKVRMSNVEGLLWQYRDYVINAAS